MNLRNGNNKTNERMLSIDICKKNFIFLFSKTAETFDPSDYWKTWELSNMSNLAELFNLLHSNVANKILLVLQSTADVVWES